MEDGKQCERLMLTASQSARFDLHLQLSQLHMKLLKDELTDKLKLCMKHRQWRTQRNKPTTPQDSGRWWWLRRFTAGHFSPRSHLNPFTETFLWGRLSKRYPHNVPLTHLNHPALLLPASLLSSGGEEPEPGRRLSSVLPDQPTGARGETDTGGTRFVSQTLRNTFLWLWRECEKSAPHEVMCCLFFIYLGRRRKSCSSEVKTERKQRRSLETVRKEFQWWDSWQSVWAAAVMSS